MKLRSFVRVGLATAAFVALPLTTGCQTRIGQAATVGDQQISSSALNGFVDRSTTSLKGAGQTVTPTQQASLQQGVLNLLVQVSLLEQVAKQHGIVVTDAQVADELATQAKQAGGQKALETQAAQNGVSATDLPIFLRKQVLLTQLQSKLKLTDSASIIKALAQPNSHVGVRINPRFGSWDPKTLAISGAPNDLSSTVTKK